MTKKYLTKKQENSLDYKHDCVIVRYNEIGIKGKNRKDFENRLLNNITHYLKHIGSDFRLSKPRGRIIIHTTDNTEGLSKIFGISSYSYAINVGADIDLIKKAVSDMVSALDTSKKFRVSAKRLTKTFSMNSDEINREIGQLVCESTRMGVNLKKFDYDIGIEILDKDAYVFCNKIDGPGGLPVGSSATMGVHCIDVEDTILCAKRLMKRGCGVVLINCSEDIKAKLEEFSYGKPIRIFSDYKGYVAYPFRFEKALEHMKENKGFALYPLVDLD